MYWNESSTRRAEEGLEPVRSLWVGSVLPAAQRACIASFLRVGHPFELFVYGEVAGIPVGTRVRRAEEIVARERVFAYGAAAGRGAGGLGGFSNLFRYAMLLREGGCWVDTDMFCLRPFPTDEMVIGSERARDGEVVTNCGVLKCPAGSALARYCFERADAADTSMLVHGETGPALVGQAVRELGLQEAVASPEMFCCVGWFEHERLCEPGTLSPEAAGVHLWGELWRRKGSGAIPWPGPRGSVLSELAGMVGDEAGMSMAGRQETPGRELDVSTGLGRASGLDPVPRVRIEEGVGRIQDSDFPTEGRSTRIRT